MGKGGEGGRNGGEGWDGMDLGLGRGVEGLVKVRWGLWFEKRVDMGRGGGGRMVISDAGWGRSDGW